MTTIGKNPIISGIKFKTVSTRNRPIHIAQIDGPEISIAFSDADPLLTGKPNGWYWDKRGVGTSRSIGMSGTYYDSPEAALAAALAA